MINIIIHVNISLFILKNNKQSNYGGMGCGLSPPGMGFAFQNRGALYDMRPNLYNSYEPNKRPFHTIIPAFVMKDDEPYMSFGLIGGNYFFYFWL